ncbi:hypothetical protein EON66_06570, partial [archaeon]
MPVQALQTMYRVTRNKTMVEALIFIVNFVLLLVVCFGIFDVHSSFVANQSVRQQLVNRALPGSYWKKVRCVSRLLSCYVHRAQVRRRLCACAHAHS